LICIVEPTALSAPLARFYPSPNLICDERCCLRIHNSEKKTKENKKNGQKTKARLGGEKNSFAE